MRQGALLNFEGDLVEPAQETFAKFVSQPHDRKASQIGQIFYDNGSVRLYCFLDGLQFKGHAGLVCIMAPLRWARSSNGTV